MPFDVAFSLPPEEAMAWHIILGQQDGNVWDFEAGRWKEREK
ncbi:hypothetical protein OJF2_50870 [Aquisphaera giovannonii]|uniref:Uncharacterized protein n=1 Tax=Aquisphaera giovannonii TaxID=406548 RepID=A0A5B9W7H5_9BACT|nr:hypothetical protein [Aquisphaera giovannonii]QEH36503.1 hypothetical protein OJF2_50870 [Aquisphaera giovannonii]